MSGDIEIIVPEPSELDTDPVTNIICTVPLCGLVAKTTTALKMHLIKSHKIIQNEEERMLFSRKGKGGSERVKHFFCPVISCIHSTRHKRPFLRKALLKQHYQRVHAEKRFQCLKCPSRFGRQIDRLQHEKGCGQMYTCVCGCQYTSQNSLLTHARRQGHQISTPDVNLPVNQTTFTTLSCFSGKPTSSDEKTCKQSTSSIPQDQRKRLKFLLPKQPPLTSYQNTDCKSVESVMTSLSTQTSHDYTTDDDTEQFSTDSLEYCHTPLSCLSSDEPLPILDHNDITNALSDMSTQTVGDRLSLPPDVMSTGCQTGSRDILTEALRSADIETQTPWLSDHIQQSTGCQTSLKWPCQVSHMTDASFTTIQTQTSASETVMGFNTYNSVMGNFIPCGTMEPGSIDFWPNVDDVSNHALTQTDLSLMVSPEHTESSNVETQTFSPLVNYLDYPFDPSLSVNAQTQTMNSYLGSETPLTVVNTHMYTQTMDIEDIDLSEFFSVDTATQTGICSYQFR